MTSVTPASSNVFEWLCNEEPAVARSLLSDPYVAMSVFSWLPEEAQAVVLHMLPAKPSAPLHDVARSIFSLNRDAIAPAVGLGVLTEASGVWQLDARFHEALLAGIAAGETYNTAKDGGKKKARLVKDTGDSDSPSPSPPPRTASPVPVSAPDSILGSEDGVAQWEGVLRLLLGQGAEAGAKESKAHQVHRRILVAGGFLEASTHQMTSEGFQLLVQPLEVQVWRVLQVWLALQLEALSKARRPSEATEAEAVKSRFLLLVLSFPYHVEGKWYPATCASQLVQLPHFGVVVYNETKSEYKVTALGRSLATVRRREGVSSLTTDGCLIVETNNRVYAYTTDEFKVGMLKLFATVELQTEGMTVAKLTRESLTFAFEKNISADQVIDYLRSNAHPAMDTLPSTVVDMLRSWESELKRASFTAAVRITASSDHISHLHKLAVSLNPSGVLHCTDTRLVLTKRLCTRMQELK